MRPEKITYEEALSSVGNTPTWALRDIVERLPVHKRGREQARVALKFRDREFHSDSVSHRHVA